MAAEQTPVRRGTARFVAAIQRLFPAEKFASISIIWRTRSSWLRPTGDRERDEDEPWPANPCWGQRSYCVFRVSPAASVLVNDRENAVAKPSETHREERIHNELSLMLRAKRKALRNVAVPCRN